MALKPSLCQNHPERFLLTCTARAHSRSTFTEHLAWSRGLGCQGSSTCDLSHETHLGTSCFDYSSSCSKHAPRSHWVNMPIVCSRSCRHPCTSSTPPVEIRPPGLLSSASAMVTVNFGFTGVASPLSRAGRARAFGREPRSWGWSSAAGSVTVGITAEILSGSRTLACWSLCYHNHQDRPLCSAGPVRLQSPSHQCPPAPQMPCAP